MAEQDKRWGGHTAAEVAMLCDMLADQIMRHGLHSEDEAVAILTRARDCIRDLGIDAPADTQRGE